MEIQRINNLLHPSQCEALIRLTKKHLHTATVYDQTQGKRELDSDYRVSKHVKMLGDTKESMRLKLYMSKLTELPLEHVNPVEIAKTKKGGFFNWHHDGEQTAYTLLVWLTDDFTGGKTKFKAKVDKSILTPKIGDGILWSGGEDSVHKGSRVKSGVKLVATVWANHKSYIGYDRIIERVS